MTIHVTRLASSDASAFLALQTDVAAGLPPGFFIAKHADTLLGFLDGTAGAAYGIFDREVLVAAALLRLPNAAYPNPLREPRFPIVPSEDWQYHAAFLENAMVHPEARGRGYQRALIEARLDHAAASGMRWACAACHLHNQASWANLLRSGMVIVGLIERDGRIVVGLLRALGASRLDSDPRSRIAAPAQDKRLHLAALAAGFIGVRLAGRAVIYQRLNASSI